MYDIKKLYATEPGTPLRYYRRATDVPAGGRSKLIGLDVNAGDISALGNSFLDEANYADQLLPFTITLTSQNEYGKASVMALMGVELINENSGMSIDDIVTETRMTFIARTILPWRPLLGGDLRAFDAKVVGPESPLAAVRQAWEAQKQSQIVP